MKKSRINILLVAALAASTIFYAGCGQSHEDRNQSLFPEKLGDVAQLRQVKKGEDQTEKLRIVQLAPDGITKASAIIQYVDGRTALVHYRTKGPNSGTMADAKVYFAVPQKKDGQPQGDEQSKQAPLVTLESTLQGRTLARDMVLDVDGHTFVKDTVFDEQGNITHAGKLTSPTMFDAFDFVAIDSPSALKIDIAPGTVTRAVSRHQEYSVTGSGTRRTWALAVEETFYPDGTHKSQGSLDDTDGSFSTLNFAPDRTVVNKTTTDRYKSSLATETYQLDGHTLKLKTVQNTYSVTVEYYDGKGVIFERRVWGYNYSSMAITYFTLGKETYTQSWARPMDPKAKPDDPIDGSTYVLTKLQITDAKTVRVIDLADDHKTIKDETIMAAGLNSPWWEAHTTKTFRADGTLEQVQVYEKGGKLVSTKKYTAAQKVREPIGAKYMHARPFEQPPKTLPAPKRSNSFRPFF